MPENTQSQDGLRADIAIIQAAYADRVTDAFRVFTENLGMGQSEKSCADRFVRSMEIIRRTRDLALDVVAGRAMPWDGAADVAKPQAEQDSLEALSPEHRELIEQALSGTTGTRPPPPPAPIRR